MGYATNWTIFWVLALSSIALVIYSLVGKVRSFLIAIPVAGILYLMVYVIVMSQRIPRPRALTVFLLVGSAAGLVRQFRRKSAADDNVTQ